MASQKVSIKWLELILILLIASGGVAVGLGTQQGVNLYAQQFEPDNTEPSEILKMQTELTLVSSELETSQAVVVQEHIESIQLHSEIGAMRRVYPPLGNLAIPTDTIEVPMDTLTNYIDTLQSIETTARLLDIYEIQASALISDLVLLSDRLFNVPVTDTVRVAVEARLDFTAQMLETVQEQIIITKIELAHQTANRDTFTNLYPHLSQQTVLHDWSGLPLEVWANYVEKWEHVSSIETSIAQLRQDVAHLANRKGEITFLLEQKKQKNNEENILKQNNFKLLKSFFSFTLATILISLYVLIVSILIVSKSQTDTWSVNRDFIIRASVLITFILVGYQILSILGVAIVGVITVAIGFRLITQSLQGSRNRI